MKKRIEFVCTNGMRVDIPCDAIYVAENENGKCTIFELGQEDAHWEPNETYDGFRSRLIERERGEDV